MKIDTTGLRECLRAGIAEKVPPSRQTCPSLSEIASLFDPKTGSRKKKRLMGHIAHCHPCLEEFDSWLSLSREEEAFVRDVCSWAERQKDARPTDEIKENKPTYPSRTGRGFRSPLGTLIRRCAPAAATALAVMVLVLALWFVFKPSGTAEFRAAPRPGIKLIQPPPGGAIDPARPLFVWTSIAKADYYVLEIFDASLAPVWRSPETDQSRLVLPPEALDRLRSGSSYYWLVTAILRNAKRLESDVGDFSLKNQ